MTKIVYNACFGGFGLSKTAVLRGRELSGDPNWVGAVLLGEHYSDGSLNSMDYNSYGDREICRHDKILVQVIEELGAKVASGAPAKLEMRDLPPGVKYRIDEYDGCETVYTPYDYEWIVVPE